jgi:ubiquinone biosynthesis protein
MLRQVFEFGIFHADPHPGNLLFLPGNRIGFIDFGMFGQLDPGERRRMAILFWALVDGDYEAVGGQLLRMSELLPGADPAGFRAALADTVEEWFGGRAADFSIARLLVHELALGAHYRIVFPRGLMLVARALVSLEATAMIVDPQLNLAEIARPLQPELQHILRPSPQALQEHWQRHRFEYIDLALELPDLLPEAIARLREGPAIPAPPPAAAHQAARRWLSLSGAFAAGAGLAAIAHKRRRA